MVGAFSDYTVLSKVGTKLFVKLCFSEVWRGASTNGSRFLSLTWSWDGKNLPSINR
jgi:hypothetical protein